MSYKRKAFVAAATTVLLFATVSPGSAQPAEFNSGSAEVRSGVGIPGNQYFSTEATQSFAMRGEQHYVRVVDGRLMHTYRRNSGAFTTQEIGRPEDRGMFTGSVTVDHSYGINAFVRTLDGRLVRWRWLSYPGHDQVDTFIETVVPQGVAGDPSAIADGSDVRVFYVDDRGVLQQRFGYLASYRPWGNSVRGGEFGSAIQPTAGGAVSLQGRPSTFVWDGERHVFVPQSDGSLAHFFMLRDASDVHRDLWRNPGTGKPVVTAIAFGKTQQIFTVEEDGQLVRYWWSAQVRTVQRNVIGRYAHPDRPQRPAVMSDGSLVHVAMLDRSNGITRLKTHHGMPMAIDRLPIAPGAQSDPTPVLSLNLDWDNQQEHLYYNAGRIGYQVAWSGTAAPVTTEVANVAPPRPDVPVNHELTPHASLGVWYDSGPNDVRAARIDQAGQLWIVGNVQSVAPAKLVSSSAKLVGTPQLWRDSQRRLHILATTTTGDVVEFTEGTPFSDELATTGQALFRKAAPLQRNSFSPNNYGDGYLTLSTPSGTVVAYNRDGLKFEGTLLSDKQSQVPPITISSAITSWGKRDTLAVFDNVLHYTRWMTPNDGAQWTSLGALPSGAGIRGVTAHEYPNTIVVTDTAGNVFIKHLKEGTYDATWTPVGTATIAGIATLSHDHNTNITNVYGRSAGGDVLVATWFRNEASTFEEFQSQLIVRPHQPIHHDPAPVTTQSHFSPWVVTANAAGDIQAGPTQPR